VGKGLKLDGGRLDSQDKGMVIHAGGIILGTSGDFRGLIASNGELHIEARPEGTLAFPNTQIAQGGFGAARPAPSPNQAAPGLLTIRGGLIAGGGTSAFTGEAGLILNNTNLQFDPHFIKLLTRFGNLKPVAFREIP